MSTAQDTRPQPPAWPGAASRAWTLLQRLDIATPRAAYVARSLLAAALALGVAYLLELESPYSAASTVLLVINPNQGAVIGKGMWRFIGTLIGMLAAFALMAAAGQMPLLFILGFGAWLGLCVAGMTVLRHFRASGVVVAGYTIGLATYGAMGHPERTFEHVMARGSTVAVGVACLTLVAALLSRRGVRARLEAAYAGLAARVARAIAAPDGERVRQGLVGEIYGVDDLLALGKAESDELARCAAAVRNGMAALFGALVGAGETLPPGAAAQALATLREPLARSW
ncbi:MAG: FUSC family protein, partial [Achromobacter sp.]|nr:FUSC family protein [Achromobacter sp.]